MFKNILDKFSPAAAFAVKLFAAAKLDFFAAFEAGDENALKVALEKQANSADVASAVEAATSQLQLQVTAAQAKVSAFETALVKFGAQVKASDEKAGITAADIEQAINARVSIKASEQLAKHGLPTALPLAPAANAADPKGKPVAKTDADHLAHYESLPEDSKDRRDYGALHYNAIRRADLARDKASV